MNAAPDHLDNLLSEERDRLSDLVFAFEEAWARSRDHPPPLASFLPAQEPLRFAALVELAKSDLEFRLKRREAIRVEHYLQLFPELAEGPVLLALVAVEHEQRRREADLTWDEYLVRFPEHAALLRSRLVTRDSPLLVPTLLSLSAAAAGPLANYPLVPGHEVLGVLGRGGMGVVYKARQTRLNRVVALKMILAGGHAGPEALGRFLTEAAAVARLQHPHIVQIFETGQHDGLPYFTLEFVEGGSLAARAAGRPLPPREAAQVVEQVARGVAYAHGRGIVHRDLKPENVLLTPDGLPKISDFGLAKCIASEADPSPNGLTQAPSASEGTSASGLTSSGAIVGTPSYMAPEQARGESKTVGPAADTYALGAILYRLLTGRPPFQAANPLDTILHVLSDEPVPPRKLQPGVSHDLETICLKCLDKDPRRRYGSALDLADDLQRTLHGEPIRARPVSTWKRGLLWARRRPAQAALLVVSIVAVVVLLVGGLVSNAFFREAARVAEKRRQEADQARNRSQTTFKKALTAFDRLLSRPGFERMAQVPETDEVRRQILQDTVVFFRGFLKEDSPDPWIRQETGWAYQQLANVYQQLGQPDEAAKSIHQALALQEALTGEAPGEPAYRQDLAKSLFGLGELLAARDKTADAEVAFTKALALRAALVRNYPASIDYLSDLGETHFRLGSAYQDAGDSRRAEAAYRQALDVFKRAAAEEAQEPDYQESLANVCNQLSSLYQTDWRLAEAEDVTKLAVAACSRLTRDHPTNTDYRTNLAQSAVTLGSLYRLRGRLNQAEKTFQEALAIYRKLAGEHPQTADYKDATAQVLTHLGVVYGCGGKGEKDKALQAHKEAVRMFEQLVQNYPKVPSYCSSLAFSHGNLGQLYCGSGRWTDAEAAYLKARALLEGLTTTHPTNADYHSSLAFCHNNLGGLYRETGRTDQAERAYQQARTLFEDLVHNHPENLGFAAGLGSCTSNLGMLRTETGNPQAALEWYERGLRVLGQVVARNPEYADAKGYLSGLHVSRSTAWTQLGRHKEALADWDRALRLCGGYVPTPLRLGRAVTLAHLGEYARATAEARELSGKGLLEPGSLHGLALIHALAAAAVRQDTHLAAVERERLAEQNAARAVALLAEAHQAGFFKDPARLDHLKKTADVESLRRRDDFRKLLAQITLSPGKQ